MNNSFINAMQSFNINEFQYINTQFNAIKNNISKDTNELESDISNYCECYHKQHLLEDVKEYCKIHNEQSLLSYIQNYCKHTLDLLSDIKKIL
ncbi:MAG: hypothetical protein IJ848_03535 [Alphaproteobacteria bacterium]|nr:hypothetical protein [Alphaproteobacteria bacterium]